MPPLTEEELDKNFIDPLNPPFRQSYTRGGFRGRGRGRGFRGTRGGRGNNFRGRGQFRNYYREENTNDYDDKNYYNNNSHSNYEYNYNNDYVTRQYSTGGRGGYNPRYPPNQFRGGYRGRGRMYNQRNAENDNFYNPNPYYQNRSRY
jgi:hypothetical protein